MADTTTLNSLFKKLLDNVNAGKLVTDVGPGLFLTVPVLMAVSILTGTSLMPAQDLPKIGRDTEVVRRELAGEYAVLHGLVSNQTLNEGGLALLGRPTDAQNLSGDRQKTAQGEVERAAVARIALLTAHSAELQRRQNIAYDPTTANQLLQVAQLKSLLELKGTQIKSLQDQLQALEKRRAESADLSKSLSVWENNIATIAGFSVVLGVIISQANRLLFIEWLFRLGLKRMKVPVPDRTKLKPEIALDEAKEAAQRELISNYYRYAEGSLNMAIPVAFFGAVFGAYSRNFLVTTSPNLVAAIKFGCPILALILIASGFTTYRTYRFKAEEVDLAATAS